MHVMNCEQTPVGVLEHGIGFNWYDGYRQSESDGLPTYPDLKDEAGWQAMLDGLDDLNPGLIRFGLPPDPCVGDAPGTIETGNNHLQRLERIARWAEARRCNILLDPFCIPKRYQFQETPGLQAKYKWLHMAAENNRAYAREFVVPLLKHVVEERGLSAVKLFNPHNEPLVNGPYTTPEDGPDAYVHYVDMFRELTEAMTEAGLRPDKVKLAGVDCVHAENFPVLDMLARGVDIDPFIDCYTIHFYFHRFDWMHPAQFREHTIRESIDLQTARISQYCTRRGKTLLAAEVGWFPLDNDDGMPYDEEGSSRHLSALITAETMIRGMNIGITGFAIWGLINPNDQDGHWRVMAVRDGSLWKSVHLYPAYRLFTRYARPGSDIYPLKPETAEQPWQYVHATALQSPDGNVVLFVVNDALVDSKLVRFALPESWAGRTFSKYVKDDMRLGDRGDEITADHSDGRAIIEDRLMPMSLTVYVESGG